MKAHVVDGTYELFRHYHGAPPYENSAGEEVGATRAVLGSLLGMLEGGATHMGVATDHVIESWRNEEWPTYKSSAGMPEDILSQFELFEEALQLMGLVVWPMTDLEADDALASAAAVLSEDPRLSQVLICTPDKDLGQCVRGDRVVCLDRRKGVIVDEVAVRERFGVGPESVPDWLGLVGDSADGFPGLAGWGAKAASAVLGRYGSIEAIPPGRVGLEGGPARSPGGQPGSNARKGLRTGDAFQEAGDLRREAGDPPSRGRRPRQPGLARTERGLRANVRPPGSPEPGAAHGSTSRARASVRAKRQLRKVDRLAEQVMVARPADRDCAQAGKVRGEPLDVEQLPASRSHGLDQGDESDLGGVALAVEHRLPREEPADRHPVEPSSQFTVGRPGLHALRPTELVEAEVGVPHPSVDPPTRPGWVGAACHDVVEGRAEADLVAPAGLPKRGAHHQTVQRYDASRVGRPPRHLVGHRHGEQPAAVSGQQSARLQVSADSHHFAGTRHARLGLGGAGELPSRRRRLDGARHDSSLPTRLPPQRATRT